MKKAFLLFLVLWSIACSAQTIGVVETGTYKITGDLKPVKIYWESLLENQKNYSQLGDFTIRSGEDQLLKTTFYMLYAETTDGSAKMAGKLELKNQVFTLTNDITGICICTGCTTSCNPGMNNGNWICMDGCADKSCNKSVTARSSGQ
jgi:hypothetical protein